MNAWVWLRGAVVPANEAKISVLDRGFLYGDSVYEVVRTFGGKPFRLAEHLDRLARSAAGLVLALPERGVIEQAIAALLAHAGSTGDFYLRVVVTRGTGQLGLDPALAGEPALMLLLQPVHPPPAEAYRDGVAVVLSSRSRSSPTLKTGNYLESVMATREARLVGAHEALVRDGVGRITEGSSSNVFLVAGGRLRTPPIHAGLLPGITRAAVIELCQGAGLAVDEVHLWPTDLELAEEMFLTSSIRGVLPVTRCGAHTVGDGRPGPITKQVMTLYDAATRAA